MHLCCCTSPQAEPAHKPLPVLPLLMAVPPPLHSCTPRIPSPFNPVQRVAAWRRPCACNSSAPRRRAPQRRRRRSMRGRARGAGRPGHSHLTRPQHASVLGEGSSSSVGTGRRAAHAARCAGCSRQAAREREQWGYGERVRVAWAGGYGRRTGAHRRRQRLSFTAPLLNFLKAAAARSYCAQLRRAISAAK